MPENDVTIKVTYNERVNSKTGDHIFIYMSIFGLSIISLLGIRLYQIKRKDN